jgi:hypothetical protein
LNQGGGARLKGRILRILAQTLAEEYFDEWLAHLPDFSPPYKSQGKVVHRPWFSPEEYKQL